MDTAASQRTSNEPVLHDDRSHSDALNATVGRQLLAELESTLAFADYCRFIGQEHVSSRAEELTCIAERLYEDTLASIRHAAGPDLDDTLSPPD